MKLSFHSESDTSLGMLEQKHVLHLLNGRRLFIHHILSSTGQVVPILLRVSHCKHVQSFETSNYTTRDSTLEVLGFRGLRIEDGVESFELRVTVIIYEQYDRNREF